MSVSDDYISFNWPHMTGRELHYMARAGFEGKLSGDGAYTARCHARLAAYTGSKKALLTHSCTAALEMSAFLLNLEPGDEVIMPSYTFVSTANAFVLRGAVPVFVDIRADTLNIDEQRIADAITARTKAIVPVHYAGVACEMDTIMQLAGKHGLAVVEDAAQGFMACYKGRALGGIGDLAAYSFHETKNIISGEGGCLLVNRLDMVERAEIIREKGTDRSRFFRGEVDKYTWQDIGSSFLPGEMVAAFLWGQLEDVVSITNARMALWGYYHGRLAKLEQEGLLRRPLIPADCRHNAHMYYVVLPPSIERQRILDYLKSRNIQAVSHYVPLHDSPAGKRFGRAHGVLGNTSQLSEKIIRLPLWLGLTQGQQDRVLDELENALRLAV